MNDNPKRDHRAQEFAKLAGVTVRALHHYDRMGLLRPRRTEQGYRAYSDSDLERLEQIVALKFIGFPLKQIKLLLDRDALELSQALRMQVRVLQAKRCLLDRAIAAIEEAGSAIAPGQRPDARILRKIIEVMEMQNDTSWMLKYFSETASPSPEELRRFLSPEL